MKRTGSGSGPRQDGCTCGELVPEHLPGCPVVPFAAAIPSPETNPAGVLPPNTRLILASDNLLDEWGMRTDRGERITVEWGDPSPEGWYEPLFTVHSDDRAGVLDEAALREALMPRHLFSHDGWNCDAGVDEKAAEDFARILAAEYAAALGRSGSDR